MRDTEEGILNDKPHSSDSRVLLFIKKERGKERKMMEGEATASGGYHKTKRVIIVLKKLPILIRKVDGTFRVPKYIPPPPFGPFQLCIMSIVILLIHYNVVGQWHIQPKHLGPLVSAVRLNTESKGECRF